MVRIEFSLIPYTETDFQTMVDLMPAFKREKGIAVHLKRMERGNAWSQLIGIVTPGHGTGFSHVGFTWMHSLLTMNALRPPHSPETRKNRI